VRVDICVVYVVCVCVTKSEVLGMFGQRVLSGGG
jgi:hypothetical protein